MNLRTDSIIPGSGHWIPSQPARPPFIPRPTPGGISGAPNFLTSAARTPGFCAQVGTFFRRLTYLAYFAVIAWVIISVIRNLIREQPKKDGSKAAPQPNSPDTQQAVSQPEAVVLGASPLPAGEPALDAPPVEGGAAVTSELSQPDSTTSTISQETKTVLDTEESDETGNESPDDLSKDFVHLSPPPSSPPPVVDASLDLGVSKRPKSDDDFSLDDR